MQLTFPADRFYWAIRNDRVTEVAELVDQFREALEWQWQDGHRPLHLAVLFKARQVQEFLLNSGADPEARIQAPTDPEGGEDHALRALRQGLRACDMLY